jgi:DNA-binding NarL/FixJ family response regulator
MAEGRSNAGVAKILTVTEKTVEFHVSSIFSKLGLEPSDGDHRRVLAVLAYLDSRTGVASDPASPGGRQAT